MIRKFESLAQNLLLALLPKVGCTNWKKVIMFLENKISLEKRKLAIEKGLPKAINGLEATDFGRGKYFQKLPQAEKDDLLNSRKKMLVIREPLQSKDFNDKTPPVRNQGSIVYGIRSREGPVRGPARF